MRHLETNAFHVKLLLVMDISELETIVRALKLPFFFIYFFRPFFFSAFFFMRRKFWPNIFLVMCLASASFFLLAHASNVHT
jgi:hypothetical protein